MRCDLHVHSIHSGKCTLPVLRALCRESYSQPQAVYAQLKELGMGLVTISDHDSIDAAEALRRHPDFFVSEEVTCTMPSGAEAHIGVYDIRERQHAEIQRRRNDLPRLVAYLEEQGIFFCLNHAFSSLTGRRHGEDFEWFLEAIPALETLNGHVLTYNNRQAARFAERSGKLALGGSDAHTLWSLGSAYTEVPGARNKREFLNGLRRGAARVGGGSGSYWRLTRDVLLITAAMIAEKPAKFILAPLALAIPVGTLVNYFLEKNFARIWERRLSAGTGFGMRSKPATSQSEEAVA